MNVADGNSRYGSALGIPVIYLGGYRPRAQYLARLEAADVGIAVNNLDHDNDMSRKFVLAQENNFSPLLVGVWSIARTKKDNHVMTWYLEDALIMPDREKQIRHEDLLAKFTGFPVAQTIEKVIRKVARRLAEKKMPPDPSPLRLEELVDAYKSANKRLLIFDYDGTLTPIVNNPDDAVPTKALLESLTRLVNHEGNIVYIISGRSRKFLEKHFGSIKKLGLSAEHGCFLRKHDNESQEWEDMTAGLNMGWKSQIEAAFGPLEARWPHSWIEKKEVAMVWHYRNATDHEACFKAAKKVKETIEAGLATEFDLDIMLGKANLEARPRSLNKGSTVTELIKLLGVDGNGKFVFCAGDDTTDEDMFRSVLSWCYSPEHIFTCLVDQDVKPTLADFRVNEPETLTRVLSTLAQVE